MSDMKEFAQSEPTASRRSLAFRLLLSSDHVTPATGLGGWTGSEIEVKKEAGAFAPFAGTVLEIGGGWYSYTFALAELDTLGRIQLKVAKATADAQGAEGQVITLEEQYGHLYDGAIWIDGLNGTAGDVPGINGTKANPCTTLVDARTLADAFGYRRYNIYTSGSALTALSMTADHTDWVFQGVGNLGIRPFIELDSTAEPDIAGSLFRDLSLFGDFVGVTAAITLEDCSLGDVDGLGVNIFSRRCKLIGTTYNFPSAGGVLRADELDAETSLPKFTLSDKDALLVLKRFRGNLEIDWTHGASTLLPSSTISWEVPGFLIISGTGSGSKILVDNVDTIKQAGFTEFVLGSSFDIAPDLPERWARRYNFEGEQAIFVADVGPVNLIFGQTGTRAEPASLAQAKTLQTELGINRFVNATGGLVTFDEQLKGTFEVAGGNQFVVGWEFDDAGGGDPDGSTFRRGLISGVVDDLNEGIALEDCNIEDLAIGDGSVAADDCTLNGVITFLPAKFIAGFLARKLEILPIADVGIDFAGNTDAVVVIAGFRAAAPLTPLGGTDFTIKNATEAGAAIVSVSMAGGTIVIDPSCTDGAGAAFTGIGQVADLGAGGYPVSTVGLIEEADPLVRRLVVSEDSAGDSVRVLSSAPPGSYVGMRVQWTDTNGGAGGAPATPVQRFIAKYEALDPTLVGGEVVTQAVITFDTPLPGNPEAGDTIAIALDTSQAATGGGGSGGTTAIGRHTLGSIVRLFLDIVEDSTGVLSQKPTIAILRRYDSKWFQVSDGTWQTTKVENPMEETDSTNCPGRYHFDFDQTLDKIVGSTKYTVKLTNPDDPAIFFDQSRLEYRDLVFGPLAAVTAPGLCSVQGTIFDAQSLPVPNVQVRATLEPVFKDDQGRTVESDRVVLTHTNDQGEFDLPLVRGAVFRLEINDVGFNRRVTIPDQASILFSDL